MNREWRRSIGEQIADKRKRADLTQQQLADRIKMTRAQVNRYEKGGVKDPTAETLGKIVEALEFKLDFNGILLGPEELSPLKKRPKEKRPLQLELQLETAKDVFKVWRAVQRGARLSVEKKRGKLVVSAAFGSAGQRSA